MRNKSKKTIALTAVTFISLIFIYTTSPRIYDSARNVYSSIKIFSTIMETINNEYVEEKDPTELIEKAIDGMTSSLDPHTTYMNSDYYKRWNQNFEGYFGIGVTYDIIREKITVMSVIAHGPSEKVGILPGDRIIAIDGEPAIGMKSDEVPQKLMGAKGSKVEVTIERAGWKEPQTKVIIRDEVHLESIPYAFIIKPGVGYINIIRFSATTSREMEDALAKLNAQGMKQLILDLRNNGGGYLAAAVGVVDQFFPAGKKIVYTKGRIKKSYQDYFTTDNGSYFDLPVVVLINRISASGSEIVTGALQDWDRGLVIGETSFGKGLVQSQYRFKDGSGLLMTTARYYTPSGRLIQRPYGNKDLEEYYNDIADDDLRKKWETDPSRPKFKTLILKRTVLGGGGITPDYFLSARTDTLNSLMRRLYFSEKRYLFTFVEDYLKSHPELRMEFNNFIRNYKPDNGILQQFIGYIREMEFDITNKEILENKQNLQFMLKMTIANEIWGDEARFKVQMLRDNQLLEAIDYVSKSEILLAKTKAAEK